MDSLIECFLVNALKYPTKTAIFYKNEAFTYSEVKNRILKAAVFLQKQSITTGDCVLIYAASHPNFIYFYLAVHLLNAIAIPIDPEISLTTLTHIKRKTSPKLVVDPLEDLKFDAIEQHDLLETNDLNKQSLIADILFTSGTTGEPKGVALTHLSLVHSIKHINEFIQNTADDIEIITVPLCHSFGLGRVRCILAQGGSIILIDKLNSLNAFFTALKDHKATGISFVPSGIAILLKLTKNKISEFSNQINYIEIGSAPMSVEHKVELLSYLPSTRICLHYGLTEASRSTFIKLNKENLNTIGRPTANVKIKIVDENKNELPIGQIGELCINGPHIMHSYWNEPFLTQQTLDKGWLYSGDLVSQDKQGYLYLQGRKNDLINVGGKKLSPEEVERLLNSHPAIKESACIGVKCPNNLMGELVEAHLVLLPKHSQPSDVELTNFLRNKLEVYKIPSFYRWVEEIPRTSTGKIQRSRLRDKTPVFG